MTRTLTLSLVPLSLLLACTAAAAGPDGRDLERSEPARVAAAAAPGELSLRLSGFRNTSGQVLIAVFRGEDGFPGDSARAWRRLVVKISDGQARVTIPDLSPGEYAVAAVHDENSNNALDTSWIGMPKEGIGMSNNAKGRMGPPKYRDAKFTVTAAGAEQTITMVYL